MHKNAEYFFFRQFLAFYISLLQVLLFAYL